LRPGGRRPGRGIAGRALAVAGRLRQVRPPGGARAPAPRPGEPVAGQAPPEAAAAPPAEPPRVRARGPNAAAAAGRSGGGAAPAGARVKVVLTRRGAGGGVYLLVGLRMELAPRAHPDDAWEHRVSLYRDADAPVRQGGETSGAGVPTGRAEADWRVIADRLP